MTTNWSFRWTTFPLRVYLWTKPRSAWIGHGTNFNWSSWRLRLLNFLVYDTPPVSKVCLSLILTTRYDRSLPSFLTPSIPVSLPSHPFTLLMPVYIFTMILPSNDHRFFLPCYPPFPARTIYCNAMSVWLKLWDITSGLILDTLPACQTIIDTHEAVLSNPSSPHQNIWSHSGGKLSIAVDM